MIDIIEPLDSSFPSNLMFHALLVVYVGFENLILWKYLGLQLK